ncbi:MAG: hypothetical protein HXX80_04795 [Nitrososphaerales archaeon]|nr:hypothetical protein [Nitrososphaerales archaeon]
MSEVLDLFKEQESNRKWFEENHENLVKRYDGKFIAIYEQKIVGFDEDVGRLMERIKKKYPLDRVSVEHVSKEKLQLIL